MSMSEKDKKKKKEKKKEVNKGINKCRHKKLPYLIAYKDVLKKKKKVQKITLNLKSSRVNFGLLARSSNVAVALN